MLRRLILLALLVLPALGFTQEPIRVAIKEAPPFVVKTADGNWSGPAVELWQHAAGVMNRPFEYREKDLAGLLTAVESGEVDIAVGALSVTTARERRFDFTHPFHTTGFGIATLQLDSGGWLAVLKKLVSGPFLTAAGGLLLILLLTGLIVFLLERRKNPEQFGGNWVQGLGSGLWWSAVTMTTVGYGDKAPVTPAGRFVALLWMFIAIITISGFTASIASSLTVERLTTIQSAEDLKSARVGTVASSSSEEYLRDERIAPRAYANLPEALEKLASGELDAVVYDLPLLAYHLAQQPQWSEIAVLPESLTVQHYAFAVPSGSTLREPLNQIIPEHIGTDAWRQKVQAY